MTVSKPRVSIDEVLRGPVSGPRRALGDDAAARRTPGRCEASSAP
ncbi:hypothetical protein L842_2413 [Mycobacterium intracellulare MIN_052511_1280]|nr:hypothetical protein L842_2413 [Mycobacterium intracellulare MIN_052511_1280]